MILNDASTDYMPDLPGQSRTEPIPGVIHGDLSCSYYPTFAADAPH